MAANTKNLFESMTRRRVSCPQVTQQLWDAIKNIRNQRQVPTSERVQKYMLKEFGVNEEEVVRQLNHCVRDGLIEITKRTINKGTYVGSEQEGYKLPLLTLKQDDFDWYCFDCHRAGDVICCSRPNCLRVYHLACISSTELPEGDFVCHVCKMCEMTPDKFQMKKSKLNKLMGHTLQRLKSKYPLMLKDQRIPPPNKNVLVSDRLAQVLTPPAIPPPDENEAWRTQLLIARDMNLLLIEDKIDRHRYKLLEEFHVDVLNIVHNQVIYNGVDSAVADIARQMLRDCVQDLQEIRQCVDCYKQSRDKKKLWFCKPCRKPHELVYAKQSGFPYWPAKVIKIEDEQYDVRFFGAQHIRAMIPKAHIRPISVNIHTLQVKRSSAWNRACEELKKHQELLEKARVATENFTKFVDSSSSSDYESVDTEQELQIEKEARLKKHKAIMEKHNALLMKQKIKRRRSSSVVSTVKTVESVASKKKRGRPTKAGEGGSLSTGKSKKGRKKKEVYDFSSDSLDSFNFNNSSKNESAPKKNTDELFDELLKSGAEKPKSLKSDGKTEDGSDVKSKKWLAIGSETKFSKSNKTADKKENKKISDSSDSSDEEFTKRGVKKIKNKSETFDSSTVSSVDTFESKKKSVTSKSSTIFGLKEQNQNLTFEKIARGHQDIIKDLNADNKKKIGNKLSKKIYTSSSEADDESDFSSKEESDSDFAGSSSNKKKPNSKIKKLPVKTGKKESQSDNSKSKSKKSDLESEDDSDSDSESLEDVKPTKKVKTPVKKPKGKPEPVVKKQKPPVAKQKKLDESSDDSDDDSSNQKRKTPIKKTGPTAKPETRVKLPLDRVAKGKKDVSSDSETPLKDGRAKLKDTSESTDVDVGTPKKQQTRSVTKKEAGADAKTPGKKPEKPTQRANVRQKKEISSESTDLEAKDKSSKKDIKKGLKESNSSDSEEPLSLKTEGKKEIERRGAFKKFGEKVKNESSDSDSPLNKSGKLKDTESESELEKNAKKTTKKSKTESLEEKVQKIKKQKNILDDKKGKGKKGEDKEELKEKEETLVSSSSQEPITRSVAVQTAKVEVPVEESPELLRKTERIAELEKDLEAQISTYTVLEKELNKTRVLLERIKNAHEDEIAELNSKHAMNVSEIKKKQWCSNCETEAIYHCCWNTAYCSVECQQAHWAQEHKKLCRRKR